MPPRTDQEQARRTKRDRLVALNLDPYPARVERTHAVQVVLRDFDTLARQHAAVALVGRVRALRLHGGSLFCDLDDGSGKIQAFITAEELGETFHTLVDTLDLGDFLAVRGHPYVTKRGERSLKSTAARIVSKALRPLPDKRHGLEDIELRYRHRELDLIANEASRRLITTRSTVLRALREYLTQHGFLEVETPILQPIPGGATARPFVTHHNALDTDFFLRVAPELYLKRLIIGGLERVFEVARCFRNEGIDHQHNPEFTQLELYAAYLDYTALMTMTEELLRSVATAVNGTPTFIIKDKTVDLSKPLPRLTYRQTILAHAKLDIDDYPDQRSLSAKAKALHVDVEAGDNRGQILDQLFKALVRPHIVNPIFLTDHPIELSPLAKKKADNPKYVERFQVIVAGSELCNAFSELNDPIDQRERFKLQEQYRADGDDEAQRLDEDFLEALEYAMPPTAGLGIGIDRFTMILTNNHSIKEAIAFPTLKPKA